MADEKQNPDQQGLTDIQDRVSGTPDPKEQRTDLKAELDVQKPGALHDKYLEGLKILEKDEEKERIKDDETKLKSASIKDIRKNSRLLNQKKEKETDEEVITNIKDETLRRLNAYTKEKTGEWYTLDYEKMGSDKAGFTHEMNIGLGDILLDTDIKEVLVIKDGKPVKGTRVDKVATGKHKGRVGFVDENGEYIATRTNDKFRILSGTAVDTKKPEEIKKYIEDIKKDEDSREKAEVIFNKRLSVMDSTNAPDLEITDLDQSKDVVEQIVFKLRPGQIEAARLIEQEFVKAGLTNKNLIAAAIANAFKESSLRPDNGATIQPWVDEKGKKHKGEDSWGLFALNGWGGLGDGMTKEERQDPIKNIGKMIAHLKSPVGQRLRAKAENGGTAQDLARIFCIDLECPAKPNLRANERAMAALSLFPKKEVEFKDDIKFEYAQGPMPVVVDVKKGQDTWFLGSSTAVRIEKENTDRNYGVIAYGGANPTSFYNELTSVIWPRVKKMDMPERVVLAGLGVNGLEGKKDPDVTARENMEGYMKIAKFLKSKGVAEVKISTTQLHVPKKPQIIAFNNLLKTEYKEYLIDSGIDTEEEPLDVDRLHLLRGGTVKIIKAGLKRDTRTA